MRFSERMGFKKPKSIIQMDEMDRELRNSIWNVIRRNALVGSGNIHAFSHLMWEHFLRRRVDELPPHPNQKYEAVSDWYLRAEWSEVYDFVEFVCDALSDTYRLIPEVNAVLERELSGYRIVDNLCVPISDKVEIESIEGALSQDKFNGVRAHIRSALQHLSRREGPDYRNSIKESISAVESVCCSIAGDKNATLGQALNVLESRGVIHGALKTGMSAFYGYSSDADGIRHAMMQESNLSADDARYFLVSCSAFVNYLISKTS